ncbi:MAG: O-antigen ligase family protein [Nitrospirae bacterium]|nr:O-antigen ligase family protein [Nitrospirota bacterium]
MLGRNLIVAALAIAMMAALAMVLSAEVSMVTLVGLAGGSLVFLLTFIMPELTIHIVILSMLLSPEWMVGGSEYEIGGHSTATLRVEDVLMFFLGMSWLARIAIMKEIEVVRGNLLNGPILAYLMACLLGTGWGLLGGNVKSVSAAGFYLLKYFEYFFLFYTVVTFVRRADQVRRLVLTFFITAVIVSLVGISQIPQGQRISAPFEGAGEPNTFGGYLIFIMGLCLGMVLTVDRLGAKIGALLLLAFFGIPLVYTQSRSSWVGLIPMGLAALVWHPRKILALNLILAAVALWFVAVPAEVRDLASQRIERTFVPEGGHSEEMLGVVFDESTSARISTWKRSLVRWTESPIVGHGVTSVFADAQLPRVLVESGTVGLAAFLWLVITMFRVGVRANRAVAGSTYFSSLTSGYVIGMAAVMGHSLGANTFVIVRIMEPVWFLTGIMLIIPTLPEFSASEEAQTIQPESVPSALPAQAPTFLR